MLQSMWLQGVGQDLATEPQEQQYYLDFRFSFFFLVDVLGFQIYILKSSEAAFGYYATSYTVQ